VAKGPLHQMALDIQYLNGLGVDVLPRRFHLWVSVQDHARVCLDPRTEDKVLVRESRDSLVITTDPIRLRQPP
jgi:hypothetical protein